MIDIIHGYDGDRRAWINTGSGWQENNSYAPPIDIVDNDDSTYDDTGFRLADITNDGRQEIIYSNKTEGTRSIWKLNDTGWVKETQWDIPFYFVLSHATLCGNSSLTEYGDSGLRIVDMNGDGLNDFWGKGKNIYSNQFYKNNGIYSTSNRFPSESISEGGIKNFLDNPCGASPMGDMGYRLFDANGDGLMDVLEARQDFGDKDAYINNGKGGWVEDIDWESPQDFIDSNGNDNGVRFVDLNGDGSIDFIKAQNDYLNKNVKAYLLNKIKTDLGETISIDYMTSTSLNNTGNDSLSDLGFNVWVVSNITKNSGISEVQNNQIIKYNYSGGLHDYKDREFRGFSYVEENLENKKIKHYYHQDDLKKGIEYKTEIFDNNSIYQKTESFYNVTEMGGYSIVLLANFSDYTYDGDNSNPKEKFTSYEYDSYGNIIRTYNKGDVNNANDDKYEYYEYVVNESAWIVNKVKNYTVYDSDDSTRIKESLYTYDNLVYDQTPTKGSLTSKEDFLDNGNNPINNFSYDDFGNLINQTDANVQVTKYIYGIRDTTNTFVDRIINAKGHITNYDYDLGTGNLLWEIDSNGFTTNYTYDVFGRIEKEILPFDNITYPTKEYEYTFNGTAPKKVKISNREVNGTSNTIDEYYFYDGNDKLIQTKQESDNSKQIVTDIYYDEFDRIDKQNNPYLIDFFENYSTANSSINITNYSYDVLDRVIKIINPDNTQTNITYDHWNITLYDENNHRKDNEKDAYDNIIEVREYNDGDIYYTKYDYDVTNNLIKINDSKNNIFNYTHDSLQRKTSMEDPDLGTWNYSYDSAGNLITQIDNRNNITSLDYDELNRVIQKNSSSQSINYTYDENKNNTITKIESNSITISYNYDDRIRKIGEINIIDNINFVINYTYDSLDRTTSLTLPNNEEINYSYNDKGLLSNILGIVNITHNEQDQVLSRHYNNNLITNFTYDTENFRLSQIKTLGMQELDYAYDNLGNVKQINDTNNKKRFSMNYDDLDRLMWTEINNHTAGNNKNLNYSYNSIGNMLNITLYDGVYFDNVSFVYDNVKVHAVSNMNTSTFISNDTDKFFIKDSSDDSVAWLGNKGNIALKGQCYSGASCDSPGDESFIIRNSSGDNVAYINSTGDLCLTSGDCTDNYNTCNNAGDGSFIIRNSTDNNMSYINSTGSLCLTGTLYQNSDVDSLTSKDYTYDANGNMINDGDKSYEYDEFNRMINVKNSGGSLISEYLYNSEGNRMRKIEYEGGSNTTTYYIDESFVRIVDSSGTYNQTYYYDNDKLIAENNTNNDLIYYHPDHLGSTSLITSSAGNLIEETFYLPFGDVIDGGDSRFTYTGQESDSETGLMYYGARYYDPVLRHFVQADSVIGNIYNPQDLNHYAYVRNNPYKYIDPDGEKLIGFTIRVLIFTINVLNKIPGVNIEVETAINIALKSLESQVRNAILDLKEDRDPQGYLEIIEDTQRAKDSGLFEEDKDDLLELEELDFQSNLGNTFGSSSTQEQSLKEIVKIVRIPQEKITILP